MPTYISLINWTDQGIRNVKEAPRRLDAFKKEAEAAGGKVSRYYLTMGRYDGLLIVECPNDEVAATLLLSGGSQGNVNTETLKAFNEAEYREIIAKIP
jgi:uncharacterized protein with GYD domain